MTLYLAIEIASCIATIVSTVIALLSYLKKNKE